MGSQFAHGYARTFFSAVAHPQTACCIYPTRLSCSRRNAAPCSRLTKIRADTRSPVPLGPPLQVAQRVAPSAIDSADRVRRWPRGNAARARGRDNAARGEVVANRPRGDPVAAGSFVRSGTRVARVALKCRPRCCSAATARLRYKFIRPETVGVSSRTNRRI